jgi:hypothetical protein
LRRRKHTKNTKERYNLCDNYLFVLKTRKKKEQRGDFGQNWPKTTPLPVEKDENSRTNIRAGWVLERRRFVKIEIPYIWKKIKNECHSLFHNERYIT